MPRRYDAALAPHRALAAAYSRRSHPDDVRRVAVVGNAPLAPDPARAAAVDACDLVVRVNGFALDEPGAPAERRALGERADVVVLAMASHPSAWTFADHPRRLYVVPNGSTIHFGVLQRPTWPTSLAPVFVPNREVTLPLSEALGIPTATAPRWPTTGTTALGWAVALFPRAHLVVAGFSFVHDPGQTSWEHATGAPCAVSPEHDLARESALLRRWIGEGRATDVTHGVGAAAAGHQAVQPPSTAMV